MTKKRSSEFSTDRKCRFWGKIRKKVVLKFFGQMWSGEFFLKHALLNNSVDNPYCIVFIHLYSAIHSLSLSEAFPTTRRSSTGNCKRRTCPRPVYVTARVGFEHATLPSKGIDSTNAPPRPYINVPLQLHSNN